MDERGDNHGSEFVKLIINVQIDSCDLMFYFNLYFCYFLVHLFIQVSLSLQ